MITASEDRMEMLRLALKDLPYCVVSDFEMKREGNTYTAHTLALLKEEYPQHQFYFIIGADSLFQIEQWYHPEIVMALTSLMVSGREYEGTERSLDEQIAYLSEKYGAKICRLHNEEVDIASADIRKKVAENKEIRKEVPEAVARYIHEHGLYR